MEALIGNTFAVMGAAFLLRLHCLEWFIAGVLGWIGTNTSHSGFDLPWSKQRFHSLPNQFGDRGYSDFHDYHHQFFHGNYGFGLYMDWLYGTDKAWKKYCEDRASKLALAKTE